ncbi:peptide-methionine (R)-S-oxide reductase [Kluyveromyces lactis]|uniref:Peptide-methionine (R)-S-oxide reductase n=1 Tax=Kluyveromyces lactis (strain ATCC 8585 / CBS 2359 / DSM 70799 / NBRC 1267 / NRRL Y-1140 / WM37) TaxID=284590 RepID=Q6CUY4_KLULA|nr:uncharacterized protein KLLA0_C01342g [Kluyveromyces lactis]CAH01106.1 KLLA0C01342p [Kluyveromyces lactis]|eukprot:XP_452255.1 uncharacterized protein KLLA0_C01342g [Kluyveromyces lactis]
MSHAIVKRKQLETRICNHHRIYCSAFIILLIGIILKVLPLHNCFTLLMLSRSCSRILSLNLSKQFYRTMNSTGKWNPSLTSEQLRVLRDKGTERPNTGNYLHNKQTGIYSCANCDLPIYKSETKFDSGCGWPAFYDAIPGSLTFTRDESFGMVRIEICCSRCGGHMGHVFEGEGWQKILNLPTDQRHCVNSCSLNFKEG